MASEADCVAVVDNVDSEVLPSSQSPDSRESETDEFADECDFEISLSPNFLDSSLNNFAEFVDEHPLIESCRDLEGLRKHEDFKDMEIPVKNGIILAQKIILAARIPFLRKRVSGRVLWERSEVDIECAEAIVSYAYTGKLTITSENVLNILSFSKDLQLEHIVEFCCKFVIPRLNLNNLTSFWTLSKEKSIPILRNSCLNLMQSEFETFVSTSLFGELEVEEFKSLITDDDLEVSGEEGVLKAIEMWISSDQRTDRLDRLTDLMKCIRWGETSAEFRRNVSKDNEMVRRNLSCVNYLLDVEQTISNSSEYFNPNPRIGGDKVFITFGKLSSDKDEWIAAKYDPREKAGSVLMHLSFRAHAAVASLGNGKLMIVGGHLKAKACSAVEELSCRKRRAFSVAPLTVARAHLGVCVVGDAVLACGGSDDCDKRLNSCEVYFQNQDRWSPFPAMSEYRSELAVVSLPDRRVFALGGHNVDNALSSVEVCQLPVDFNLSSPSDASVWRSLAPMREARFGHAAVHFRGSIIVAGGYGAENLSSVELLSINSDDNDGQWISLSPMNEKRRYLSLLASSQYIFAFGNDTSPSNTVERLQIGTTWINESPTSKKPVFEYIPSAHWEILSPVATNYSVTGVVSIPKSMLPLDPDSEKT